MNSLTKSSHLTIGFPELLDRSSRVSVRLSRAIRRAVANREIPYQTIAAYLSDGDLGRYRMSRIENIGRKSIAELDLLIAEASVNGALVAAADEAPRSVDLAQAEISFPDLLDLFIGVDSALQKVVGDATNGGYFPYGTVKEYIEAKQIGRNALAELQGMTPDLISKLDHLLVESGYVVSAITLEPHEVEAKPFLLGDVVAVDQRDSSERLEAPSPELLDLSIPAFVEGLGKRKASRRLRDEASNASKLLDQTFNSLREYLSSGSRQAKLENEGGFSRRSVRELEKLLIVAIGHNQSKEVNFERNPNGYIDIGLAMNQALATCDARQLAVLTGRMFEKRTLEEMASRCSVTRERIRQIEARLIRSLWLNFGPPLISAAEDTRKRLKDSNLRELALGEFCRLGSCNAQDATILISLLKKFDKENAPLGLADGHVYLRAEFAPRSAWETAIRNELPTVGFWTDLQEAAAAIETVPSFFVREHVNRSSLMDAGDAEGARRRLKTSRICIEILRRAGKPLHTSEARARIWEDFKVDIEEHAINATMGRLRGAVISAPGTYVLYEHLPYSDAQVERIRNMAHDYLAEKAVFLSSKIIFDDVFASMASDLSDINHYVVMGILQDDPRFVTKRGNMIGLVTFDVSEAYTPLQDEIVRIVITHGPVTLQEISARLSETRRLCNDSGIRLVLAQSKDVIQTGKRTYDALHRFFEDRKEYEEFTLAIRLSLLDRQKTTYAIHRDLDCAGLSKATPQLIESIITSMADVSTEGDVHKLTAEDSDLSAYQRAVQATSGQAESLEVVRNQLRDIVPTEKLDNFVRLDARFAKKSTDTPIGGQHEELDSILKDFGL